MIAAVPSDPLAGLMAQMQNASGDAAAGGFDLLLNVLMALDADTASSETAAAGSELLELATGATGEETLGQGNAETTDQNAAPLPLATGTDTWMQMPVQADAPTETVSPEAQTGDDSATVPECLTVLVQPKAAQAPVEPQSGKAAQAAAQPVIAALQKNVAAPESETETLDAGNKTATATAQTTIQQVFAAPPTAAVINTPVQPAAKKPAESTEQDAGAAATVINIAPAQPAPTSAEPAAQAIVQTAQASANVVSMKPARVATAKNQPGTEAVAAEAAQPELVAEIATATVQPAAAAPTTTVPAQAAAPVSTQTVPAQAAATTAPATAQPAAANTTAATAEPAAPFKWNLSELIHRFDEQLKQVMGDEKPVEQAAIKAQAQNVPAAETSAAETPVLKTMTVAPETKATKETETVAVAPQQATLTFEARPKTEVTAENRTATLVDQVRQASEWLAEKAEGSIRYGDHGVEANMKLYPPDMGGVRVSLNVGNDLNVQAQFVADRPETAQAIRQNLDQLQTAFARQGLSLDKVQVVVAPGAGSQSGSAGQQNYQAPRRDADTMAQQQGRQFNQNNSQERRQREQA
ncbi:MAG: flagellar hook-length control protein FliK [Candidatus Sumerlaeia bacterium]